MSNIFRRRRALKSAESVVKCQLQHAQASYRINCDLLKSLACFSMQDKVSGNWQAEQLKIIYMGVKLC